MATDQPETPPQEEPKHPGGRPLKFETVEALDKAIAKYFKACDPHWQYVNDWVQARDAKGALRRDENGQTFYERLKVRRRTKQVVYTMAGLALSLGIDRKTLRSYKAHPEFLPSIEAAKDRCEAFWEGMLASPFANGAKFNLNNNFDDWTDKKELTGADGAPLMPTPIGLDAAILARMTNGSTPPGTEKDR